MRQYHFIGGDGKTYGPYSQEQMQQFFAENRVNPQTQVNADGGAWQPASSFPELMMTPGPGPGPGPGGGYPPPQGDTNGMAIAGMVLGILSIVTVYPCCGLPFNILGLIFSAVALSQIKRNPHQEGKGMANAGLVCSLIGLTVLALLFLFGIAGGFMEALR